MNKLSKVYNLSMNLLRIYTTLTYILYYYINVYINIYINLPTICTYYIYYSKEQIMLTYEHFVHR